MDNVKEYSCGHPYPYLFGINICSKCQQEQVKTMLTKLLPPIPKKLDLSWFSACAPSLAPRIDLKGFQTQILRPENISIPKMPEDRLAQWWTDPERDKEGVIDADLSN
jgi:hypothetical protein